IGPFQQVPFASLIVNECFLVGVLIAGWGRSPDSVGLVTNVVSDALRKLPNCLDDIFLPAHAVPDVPFLVIDAITDVVFMFLDESSPIASVVEGLRRFRSLDSKQFEYFVNSLFRHKFS